jgi:hypothetical protein
MDPHAVLGVSADADDEAIAAAYRKLAKRFHPDARPEDEAAAVRMTEINVAYAILRDSQLEMHARRAPVPKPPPRPGSWLEPQVARALGPELIAVLEPQEKILVVTDAATWDSPRVRLAVSDQRLLWLRADAPTERVRYLPFRAIASLEGRLKRPRRKVGELVVQPRAGRRVSFSELEPEAMRLVLMGVRRFVRA